MVAKRQVGEGQEAESEGDELGQHFRGSVCRSGRQMLDDLALDVDKEAPFMPSRLSPTLRGMTLRRCLRSRARGRGPYFRRLLLRLAQEQVALDR